MPTIQPSITASESNDANRGQRINGENEKPCDLTGLKKDDVIISTTTDTVSTELLTKEVNSVQEQSKTKPVVVKSPKQLLNEYYAKLHIKTDKENYTTIKHDKVQVVKFASAFTCPKTGEHFMGGKLKDCLYSEENGVVWYGKFHFSSDRRCTLLYFVCTCNSLESIP